jgi:hypothetical protein
MTFLTLSLKVLNLQGKVTSTLGDNWFQLFMVLFTKERPVTNCHECARLSNLGKRRQEEARAHIGLLSHGYYIIIILFTKEYLPISVLCFLVLIFRL